MAEPPSNQFEYSFTYSNENQEKFPLDTFTNNSGEIIYYLDSMHRITQNYRTLIAVKCYTIKIEKKSNENNDKLLIQIKFGFDAEKYRENQQATINQWKEWHETVKPTDYLGYSPRLQFFSLYNSSQDTLKCLSTSPNRDPNCQAFLWDSTLSKSSPPETECNFGVGFGCHSTQFPIQLDNGQYVGSLFVLSIDIYSVATKQKLDSASFKLKISRSNSTQFKLDSAEPVDEDQDLTEKNQNENADSNEQNLQKLLASLSIDNESKALLPSYEQLKTIQLEQGIFSCCLKSVKSSIQQDSIPVAFLKRSRDFNIIQDRSLHFELMHSHFDKFYNENDLLKTTIILEIKPSDNIINNRTYGQHQDIIVWQQNWKRSNPGKAILQFDSDYSDGIWFDVHQPSIEQICLTWLPSNKVKKNVAANGIDGFTISLKIGDNGELRFQKNFEAFLRGETFLAPNLTRNNWTKIDGAVCKLNFVDAPPSSVYKHTLLKNQFSCLVRKALFISVDGTDYKPLLFQETSHVDVNQFKTKLINFVRQIKNMETQFEINNLVYFDCDQSKQSCTFDSTIFGRLKPKAILKCNLRKVATKIEDNSQQGQTDQYDIDLINQDNNYSKAHL